MSNNQDKATVDYGNMTASERLAFCRGNGQHQGEPVAWRVGSQVFQQEHLAKLHSGGVRKPVEPLHLHADPAEVERLREHFDQVVESKALDYRLLKGENGTLRAQLAERDALLCELAEAAEEFSCSAHCETSEAGDALELLNTILARVNAHKAPKCRVCGYKLHADGYCSFRDCGVPGKGTKALSASAEPSAPKCEQCRGEGRVGGPAPDEGGGKNCPACDGTGVLDSALSASAEPSAPKCCTPTVEFERLRAALGDALDVAESRKREIKFLRRLLWYFVLGVTWISISVTIASALFVRF